MHTYHKITILFCILFDSTYEKLSDIRVVEVQPGQAPYHVALKKPEIEKELEMPKRFFTFCAGAIISKTKVLTVAECFVQHIFSKNNTRGCHECYAVAGTIRNLGYLPTGMNSSEQWRKIVNVKLSRINDFAITDVAVVYLKDPFHYNTLVKEIKYGPQPHAFKGHCNISGYSKSSYDIYSDSLMVTSLLLIPQIQCQNIYNKDVAKYICAVIDDSYTTTDLLQSMINSGSPLVCSNTSHTHDGNPVLVGLMTKTSTINNWSFLFSRISAHTKFIKGRRTGQQLMELTSNDGDCQKLMLNRYNKFLWRAENKSLDHLLEAIKAGVNVSELTGYGGAQETKDAPKKKKGNYTGGESGNKTHGNYTGGESGNKTKGNYTWGEGGNITKGNYTGDEGGNKTKGNYTVGEGGNSSIGVYGSESEIDENAEVKEEDKDPELYSDDTETNMIDKKPRKKLQIIDPNIEDPKTENATQEGDYVGAGGGNYTGGGGNYTGVGNYTGGGGNYTGGGVRSYPEGRNGNFPGNATDNMEDKKQKTQKAAPKKLAIYFICICITVLKFM